MVHQLVGDEGIDYIALTCSRAGAYFLARPRQDIGIDGHIEFLNANRRPTGAIAWIQAKAGASYVATSGKYIIRADRQHFELWLSYSTPVIGIVYNPKRRDARWINLTEYLRANPDLVESGPYRVEAPASQPFSEEAFAQFQTAMECIHLQAVSPVPQELIDAYLSDSAADKEQILYELFARYRWTPLACFFFHHALRSETDQSAISLLTYFISFYRHHADRFYGRDVDNICPYELKELASRSIRDFGIPEVLKLLSVIDEENGLERGGMGQLVGFQLYDVSDVTTKLRHIVQARRIDDRARFYSVALLIEYFQDDELDFYEQLLMAEHDPDVAEALRWAVDCITS